MLPAGLKHNCFFLQATLVLSLWSHGCLILDGSCSPDSSAHLPLMSPCLSLGQDPSAVVCGSSCSAVTVNASFNDPALSSPAIPTAGRGPGCESCQDVGDVSGGQSGQRVILTPHLLAAVFGLIWEALCSSGCVPCLCAVLPLLYP